MSGGNVLEIGWLEIKLWDANNGIEIFDKFSRNVIRVNAIMDYR